MTERPDLFGAVIINVGIINMVRAETGFNGANNTKEFGTVKNKEEFDALLEMDSYHHIQKGVKYPSTLIITGMNDARVPPWHSGKFFAKLQGFNTSTNPILLKVKFKDGHLTTNSKQKKLDNNADIITFALQHTGHPDYQPEN
ncbi:hypothetical protein AB832_03845 [Flavobacteriaceae bacterium (ex Bugula neritina AB1)]|nr:hypothetical protein AB832_03845 [Flavobacteriaceae bacterium (ex Bugula neritina AB1)]